MIAASGLSVATTFVFLCSPKRKKLSGDHERLDAATLPHELPVVAFYGVSGS
jgi:hypothetical protein